MNHQYQLIIDLRHHKTHFLQKHDPATSIRYKGKTSGITTVVNQRGKTEGLCHYPVWIHTQRGARVFPLGYDNLPLVCSHPLITPICLYRTSITLALTCTTFLACQRCGMVYNSEVYTEGS